MTHFVRLPNTETDIAIPTAAFNAVYQMGHIMIHIEDEGIGLRQMVDYYYLLRKCHSENTDITEIQSRFKEFGMLRLARSVMWIEKECLGLDEKYLLVEPDERTGRVIMKEMMEGGNFGKYSSRQGYRKYGQYAKKCVDAWHLVKLSACFPGEAFFRCIRKIVNACKMLF